jgi:thiol-disulfide isomerase/thioredoxin
MKKISLTLATIFIFNNLAMAQQAVVLELFHGKECPHCQREISCLPELKEMYPALEVKSFEVWHNDENRQLWGQRLKDFGQVPEAVPTNIIGNKKVIVGADMQGIFQAMKEFYGEPKIIKKAEEKQEEQEEQGRWWEKVTNWMSKTFLKEKASCFVPPETEEKISEDTEKVETEIKK